MSRLRAVSELYPVPTSETEFFARTPLRSHQPVRGHNEWLNTRDTDAPTGAQVASQERVRARRLRVSSESNLFPR